ncbi:hypothetical protein Agub_g9243 [Astrephomene gubernaculifera]|uniref:Uncharacterized protein n=1 Tax=Astrephomene gubernaculifera TaxID=47775 RepID=A0AAD3HP67_9CHLO|nr:hypothetical protein Agub_g9243 [Astrephomene gubernaculifera]
MAHLTLNKLPSRVSAPTPRRSGVFRAPRTVVFAQEPKFTLENNSQAAEGYVETDTAGQSNMYPTVMKPFEAGSSADTVKQDSFNTGLAVGSSLLALGAIGLGLTALVNAGASGAPEEDYSAYQPLSVYAAKFEAELAAQQQAAAPSALSAPDVVAEVVQAAPAAAVASE